MSDYKLKYKRRRQIIHIVQGIHTGYLEEPMVQADRLHPDN